MRTIHQRFRTGPLTRTLLAAAVALPVAAGTNGAAATPPVPTDRGSVDRAVLAAERLDDGLAAATVPATEQSALTEARAKVAGLRADLDAVAATLLVTDPTGDKAGAAEDVAAYLATSAEPHAADLRDEADVVLRFYRDASVEACAAAAEDLLDPAVDSGAAAVPGTDPEPDTESAGARPALPAGAYGLALTLSDCLPEGTVTSDGAVTVAGQVVARPVDNPAGTVLNGPRSAEPQDGRGGPGPSEFENVDPVEVGRVTYGGPYDSDDGSSLYMTARLYRPRVRSKDGDTLIVWQSGTATMGARTHLKRFMGTIAPQDAGRLAFEDWTPRDPAEYAAPSTVTAALAFPVRTRDTTVPVGVARDFPVSYATYGGDRSTDGERVLRTRGGYRLVAEGHRSGTRTFSHAAAWTFPRGVPESFYLTYDQYAYGV